MTNKTAQIIPFPTHLPRLGVRHLLVQARILISDAEENGLWKDDESGVTASFLLAQIPELRALHRSSDLEAAQVAIRTSLLASHAIHHGTWDGQEHLGFFLELQAAGLRLESCPALAAQESRSGT